MDDYDIVVVGGGPAGIGAAFSAAKLGLKTAILERHFMLGGNWTNGYVLSILGMYTYDGKEKIVGGIADEVVKWLEDYRGTAGKVGNFVPFRPDEMKLALDAISKNYGISVYFGSLVSSVAVKNNTIDNVIILGKNGKVTISGKMFIDSSGDADLAFHAGAKTMSGMESNGMHQEATLPFRIGNIDAAAVIEFSRKNPDLVSVVMDGDRLSRIRITQKLVDEGKKGGLYLPHANSEFLFNTSREGEYICNATHVDIADFTDGKQMASAINDARLQVESSLKFLIKTIKGFEGAYLLDSAPSIGLRETRRAVGEYVLREDDVMNNARFDDAIARCGHPIEVHDPKLGVIYRHSNGGDGSWYQIPYRAIVVKGIDNLFAVGRCLSAEFYAQASARVTGTAMAMGMAAATASKLAIEKKIKAKDVDISILQKNLKDNGAII